MASFNRVMASSAAAGSDLATVPTGKQWVVIGFSVSNVVKSLVVVTVTAGGKRLIGDDTPLPGGSKLPILGGDKLVLNDGDVIHESGAGDAEVDYIISYMEI